MLHRTQILLEPHQYQTLQEEAQRRKKSISSILREIVEYWLVEKQESWDTDIVENDPIWQICGLVPPQPDIDPATSEKTDFYLYKTDWQE